MRKLIILFFCIAILDSCKKNDYRDQYVGLYDCGYKNINIEKIENNDSYNMSAVGVIGSPIRIYVDQSGYFHSSSGPDLFFGYFINDSLYYKFSIHNNIEPISNEYTRCIKK